MKYWRILIWWTWNNNETDVRAVLWSICSINWQIKIWFKYSADRLINLMTDVFIDPSTSCLWVRLNLQHFLFGHRNRKQDQTWWCQSRTTKVDIDYWLDSGCHHDKTLWECPWAPKEEELKTPESFLIGRQSEGWFKCTRMLEHEEVITSQVTGHMMMWL